MAHAEKRARWTERTLEAESKGFIDQAYTISRWIDDAIDRVGQALTDMEQLGDRLIRFVGGSTGVWRVMTIHSLLGDVLPQVERVAVFRGNEGLPPESKWTLSGVISNVRYVERPEQKELASKQAALGRSEATMAALIPIRKTTAWWNLTQEERRNIFERKSHHIAEGIKYLPPVARQLYHSRDIGEPFDFLTWFEYAPQHSDAFEELVRTLRKTEEWQYVDREIDIRLIRESKTP